jgi:hypothetical protein
MHTMKRKNAPKEELLVHSFDIKRLTHRQVFRFIPNFSPGSDISVKAGLLVPCELKSN